VRYSDILSNIFTFSKLLILFQPVAVTMN